MKMKNKNQKFKREDFTEPQNFMKCPVCGEEIFSCNICNEVFDTINFEVACGKENGHICGYCWLDLPKGE
jgi:hypothetical protein